MYNLTHIEERIISGRNHKPLLLDGAVGSILIERLGQPKSKIWASEFNDTYPEDVIQLHRDYIAAGADIITTNTFRTNPAMRNSSEKSQQLEHKIRSGVLLAKEAASGKNVIVAGANAPAEDCYQIERTLTKDQLSENHHFHISKLYESGADFILNETQGHMDEIRIISEFCRGNSIPFAVSLFCTSDLHLLSGENIYEAITFLVGYSPLFISFNCITFNIMLKIADTAALPDSWGCYLNCGNGNITDPVIKCGIDPASYSNLMERLLNFRPAVIGACCGSSPAHINLLRRMIENNH